MCLNSLLWKYIAVDSRGEDDSLVQRPEVPDLYYFLASSELARSTGENAKRNCRHITVHVISYGATNNFQAASNKAQTQIKKCYPTDNPYHASDKDQHPIASTRGKPLVIGCSLGGSTAMHTLAALESQGITAGWTVITQNAPRSGAHMARAAIGEVFNYIIYQNDNITQMRALCYDHPCLDGLLYIPLHFFNLFFLILLGVSSLLLILVNLLVPAIANSLIPHYRPLTKTRHISVNTLGDRFVKRPIQAAKAGDRILAIPTKDAEYIHDLGINECEMQTLSHRLKQFTISRDISPSLQQLVQEYPEYMPKPSGDSHHHFHYYIHLSKHLTKEESDKAELIWQIFEWSLRPTHCHYCSGLFSSRQSECYSEFLNTTKLFTAGTDLAPIKQLSAEHKELCETAGLTINNPHPMTASTRLLGQAVF